MSELKSVYIDRTGDWARSGNDTGTFYLKSEADKVIAELKSDYKEACDRLHTANLIKDEQLAATRHHKYKRCLALKEYCLLRLDWAFRDPCLERSARHCVRWRKWTERWRFIAEYYKEEK